MRSLLPKVLAALLVAAPAASASDHGFRWLPSPCRAPAIRIGMPRLSVTFGPLGDCGRVRPVHRHRYTIACEREWVAPVYRTVAVGCDPCGRPIHRQILVRAGYWTTVRYEVCACGSRRRC